MMAKYSSTALFPFLIVTLLCVGGVELLYNGLERYLLEPTTTVQKQIETGGGGTVASGTPPLEENVDYSVITRRNLFGPPPSSADSTTATETPPVEDLEATTLEVVLMGTVDTDGDDGRAIILKKKDRSQEMYQVGEVIEGALIKDIQRGRVILTVDGRDELLDISEAREYAQNASPVAARPAVRRRPVVVAPQEAIEAPPRVVRPLRRIVRPRSAIQAEQAVEENLLNEEDVPPDTEEPDLTDTQDTEAPVDAQVQDSDNEDTISQ
ncbi:type II secretion system protein N [Desulfopila aestuarii]|uniref:Type IV pilus biogenesis n=1 Tax=Desulfopila aestuarii DSM 18488 TaxID=1121416 RepID=A0A1M7YE31_9BACT|nr:type II secretion system protein N [Desulfopila aestuarii]SHO50904.1 Type IV pilus biogenesis [Desulfopila aestuarii DSM 18488]